MSEGSPDSLWPTEAPAQTRSSGQAVIPRAAAWLVLAVCIVAEAAWITGWRSLLGTGEVWAAMRPIAAASFGILALGLQGEANGRTRFRWTLRVLDATVVALSALALYGAARGAPVMDVRMATGTALLLFVLAVAATRGITSRFAQILLTLAGATAYVNVFTYAADGRGFVGIGPLGAVSLQAATTVLLLSIGGLFADERSWLRALASGRDPGHVLLRRTVPTILVVFPIAAFGGSLGVSRGWWTEPSAILVGALGVVSMLLVSVVGVARTLMRMQAQRLESDELAERDPLTGVGNRRCLERLLARVFHDPDDRPSCALLSLDLDDFKRINDQRGVDAGDRILREFAAFIRDHMRPGDVIVRTGGDEFAIVLPDVSPLDVMSVARNITNGIVEWREGDPLRPSASIGVAIMDSDVENALDLVKRADHALQKAKQSGKAVAVLYRNSITLPKGVRSSLERSETASRGAA